MPASCLLRLRYREPAVFAAGYPTMPNRDGIMPLTKGDQSQREKAALPYHLAKEARMRESSTLRFGWLTTQTTEQQETGWVAVGGGAVVANCVQGPIRTHRLMVNGCLCDWGSGEETGKRHKQSKDRHKPNTHAFGSLSTALLVPSACGFGISLGLGEVSRQAAEIIGQTKQVGSDLHRSRPNTPTPSPSTPTNNRRPTAMAIRGNKGRRWWWYRLGRAVCNPARATPSLSQAGEALASGRAELPASHLGRISLRTEGCCSIVSSRVYE
ncbi:hypothetical protein K456DRAFT_952038 [Colletotrichum gloeosporioides 23]|nr:hypothetical protein K456DRAFT_952038 [Colletotrichum gloeosporioides 23]